MSQFMDLPTAVDAVIALLLAFFCGALPFSVWIAHFGLKRDLRHIADGNPGASNVVRAGGFGWGILALLLDLLKGAVPAYLLAFVLDWRGPLLIGGALAPILGHAFSPFLRWRGGKALAATIGVWAGLTLGEGPMMLGLFFILWEFLLDVDGWAVLLGMAGLLAHLLGNHRDPLLIAICLGNLLILAWTHRTDLQRRPHLRAWWRPSS